MDMLVKLYDLPDDSAWITRLTRQGIAVRRAMAYERCKVVAWVADQFGPSASGWVDECEAAFARLPVSCLIAVQHQRIVGFACYEVTARGMFGPIGVEGGCRVRGIGSALLISALRDMHQLGYAYAIIGHAGVPEFFAKTVGAEEIAGSTPGMYPSDSAIR